MAEKTIPVSCAPGKEKSPQTLVSLELLPDGTTPVVSSLRLAEHFEIRHHHVMRDIKAVLQKVPESFRETNFGFTSRAVAGPNNSTRDEPFYLLTRDAFTLLAMGYNSARAIAWKLRYIEAFNALEAAALRNARAAALTEGARVALGMSPLDHTRLNKVLAYLRRGFTQREIAKVMGVHRRTIQTLVRAARTMGMEGAA